MIKKIGHIILAFLLVVSTLGLTYTKYFCKTEQFPDSFVRIGKLKSNGYSHDFIFQNHNMKHAHVKKDKCVDFESCVQDFCCELDKHHNGNCCQDGVQSIKGYLFYIKDNKNLVKKLKIKLPQYEFFIFYNLHNESILFSRYSIADLPSKIKKSINFLQSYKC